MQTVKTRQQQEEAGHVLICDPPWDIHDDRKNGVRASSRWPHEYPPNRPQCVFPFLMGYACANLRAHGINAHLTTFAPPRTSYRSFLDEVVRRRYRIVLIETSTPTIQSDLAFCNDLKGRLDCLVALVGPYATANAEECIDHPSVDAVLKGEYERNGLELVETEQPGIYDYDLTKSFDTLPMPFRRDALFGRVLARNGTYGAKARDQEQMWGSRGCPYRCSFCAWPPVMYDSTGYRPRSAESIAEELDYLIRKRGNRDFFVWFDDDTFNIGDRRMVEIADVFAERGIEYAAMCRADTIRRFETLEHMRRCGFKGCAIGVESGCQKLVDSCNKKLDLDDVRQFMDWARQLDIFVHMTFTLGLPGETQETITRTKRFIEEMAPDSYQVSGCAPVKGTAYYEELRSRGVIDESTKLDGSTVLQVEGGR